MRLSTRLSLSYIGFLVLLVFLVLALVFLQVSRLANHIQTLPLPASPGVVRLAATALEKGGLTAPIPEDYTRETIEAGGWVQVLDAHGQEVAHIAGPPERTTRYTVAQLTSMASPAPSKHSWYYSVGTVGPAENPIGVVVFALPRDVVYWFFGGHYTPEFVNAFTDYFFGGVVLAVLTAVALALLAGFLYARRITRPLVRLSAELKATAAGDYTHRIPVKGKDEFAVLTQAYNHLVDRLSEAEAERSRMEQARRDLVANISHDLRTPLTSIQGFAERLAEPGATPDERRRYAELIGSRVGQLDSLLGDLLELSRLQAVPAIKREPADLAELVRESVIDLMPEIEQAGVELDADLPEDLPQVPLDGGLIRRALQNLLVNALRHSGGATQIRVALYRSADGVALEVADNGKGIPPAALPHLFDRYYRGTSATARGRGSGLGLAIVRQIAENHGGRIGVKSQEGQGTTFTLWLPIESGTN